MNRVFLLIILFLSSLAQAEIEYKSVKLSPAPMAFRLSLEQFFHSRDLSSFKHMNEIEAIGINQIFFYAPTEGYVTVKYDVDGDLPIGKVIDLEDGKVLHLKIGEKITAFYFKNIPPTLFEKLTSGLSGLELKTTVRNFLHKVSPIADSQANCEVILAAAVASSSAYESMAAVAASTIAGSLMACLQGSKSGAENVATSYAQMGAGLAQEAQDFWNNPTGKISQYYKAVDSSVRGILNFVEYVGGALADPVEGAKKLKAKFGQLGEALSQVILVAASLPPSLGVNIACSMLTSIGIDAIIGALTGVGTAKLAVTLKRALKSVEILNDLFATMKKLKLVSLKQLGLTSEGLTKLFQGIMANKVSQRSLSVFADSLEDGSELARSFALRGMQCAL